LNLSLLHTCIWEEKLAELGCQYLAHLPIIPIHPNLYIYDDDAQVYIPFPIKIYVLFSPIIYSKKLIIIFIGNPIEIAIP
jgi:hypothetical protein